MPRLLPRLLQKIAETKHLPPLTSSPPIKVRSKCKSLRQSLPETHSPPTGSRSKSILLDELNPITHAARYVKHKSLPPRIRVNASTRRRTTDLVRTYDVPRRMTVQERAWWANPYLRMLASPIRRCSLTSHYFPSDFLIRLAPMRLPSAQANDTPRHMLLPDGLEHSLFRNRKSGDGEYVACRKDALVQVGPREMYKRLAANISLPPLLIDQISHLLHVRILQELEILADRLSARPRNAEYSPVLRRLSREELSHIRSTNHIPFENAVAVLVVPPPNRNPQTKEVARPDVAVSKPTNLERVEEYERPPPPLSVLLPVSPARSASSQDAQDNPDIHPQGQVPFYNGVALFPSRPLRAALYACLTKLLKVERRARYRQQGRHPVSEKLNYQEPEATCDLKSKPDKWARGDAKASHAFLLSSDSGTALRADVVPTAIALWRLRMWEGQGWDEGDGQWVLDSNK